MLPVTNCEAMQSSPYVVWKRPISSAAAGSGGFGSQDISPLLDHNEEGLPEAALSGGLRLHLCWP